MPAGRVTDRFDALSRELANGRSTACIVLWHHTPVFAWGDAGRPSSVASVRKSLIGALYGIHVAEGRIDPDATLAGIGLDDRLGLTALEKTATIRDLLSARSGVYHPSVHDTQRGRPARGAHPPGTHWFYNNWDFNALGAIFNRLTGADLFEAFAERIAGPLGMQDFHTGDCRYQHGPESLHPVYKMRLSARDLARFGQLYLNGGAWLGRRILDRDWIAESTRSHSPLGGGRGYGYLWWTAEPHAPGDALSVDTAIYYASGYGGQYIVVVPDLDAVVVHQAANVDNGIDHAAMGRLLSLAIKALREEDR